MPVKDIILTLKLLILGQILQKCVFYDKMKNEIFWGLLAPLAMLRNANSSRYLRLTGRCLRYPHATEA